MESIDMELKYLSEIVFNGDLDTVEEIAVDGEYETY